MFIIIYSGLCQLQCCKCFCWKATVQQRHEYRTWFCTSVSIRYSKTDIKHEETKMILGFFCVLFFIMSLKEKAEEKMKVEVSCSEIPKTLFKNKLLPHIRKYINIIKVGCCDSPSFPFLKSFMNANIVRTSHPRELKLNRVWLHYSAAISTLPGLFGVAICSKVANWAISEISTNFSFQCSRIGISQLPEVTFHLTGMRQEIYLKEVKSLFQNMHEFIIKMHNEIIKKL